jgi:transposase-like protein
MRAVPLGQKLIPEEIIERAHEMVESGLSVRETARRLDVQPTQLRNKLKARGTKMRTQSESAAHRNRESAHRQHAADIAAEEIIRIFKTEDVSLYEIAERFGTARKNVRRILAEAGIPQDEIEKRQRRQIGAASTLEARKGIDLDQVAAEYATGVNLATLAEKYGVAYVTLSYRLSQMGIEIRDSRRWEFRQDAFSTLTPEAAYWVGFIEADGNIGKDRPTITIRLQEADTVVLEDFCDWIHLDRAAIKHRMHRDGFGECLLTLQSQTMYEDLMRYGIVPRKSWNWSGGFAIPDDLMPHFIRGWFDGDGVASFNKGRYVNGKLAVVGIAGLRDSLEWLQEYLQRSMPEGSVKLRTPPGKPEYFAVLEIMQKAAIATFHEYVNGTPRLERKWAKLDLHYEQWLKFGNAHWKSTLEIAERVKSLSQNGWIAATDQELAEELEVLATDDELLTQLNDVLLVKTASLELPEDIMDELGGPHLNFHNE